MSKKPIVYTSTHRVKFSELDPYDHVSTGRYATYYVDHRMESLRDDIGWDLKTITSFVREFRGADAIVECTMTDAAGNSLSRCLMTVAHVDKETNRATDWPADRMALFLENSLELS